MVNTLSSAISHVAKATRVKSIRRVWRRGRRLPRLAVQRAEISGKKYVWEKVLTPPDLVASIANGEHQAAQNREPGEQSMQFPIYVKWGYTPAQVIQAATTNAAATLNYDMGKKIGSIEKGKYADIVAVPGNPLMDINEMFNVKFVMKGGMVYRDDMTKPAGQRRTVRPRADQTACQ